MSLKVNTDAVKFKKSLEMYGNKLEKTLPQAIKMVAEGIIATSKQKYVPVDTGTLRSSGFAENPINKQGRLMIRFGFGGPAADYAYIVHENTNATHKTGEAKYLLKAVNDWEPKVVNVIIKYMRQHG